MNAPLDLRGLMPPEPMERVLDALDTITSTAPLTVLLEREPHPLYRILERNGYAWSTTGRADGVWEIIITKR
jgi:uncharacterized protein (DUF2249 family)